jgi:hypothetical protein
VRDDNLHTPSTETVRDQYASSAFGIAYRIRLGEFDRWLETFREEAFYEGYNVGYSYATGGSDDW